MLSLDEGRRKIEAIDRQIEMLRSARKQIIGRLLPRGRIVSARYFGAADTKVIYRAAIQDVTPELVSKSGLDVMIRIDTRGGERSLYLRNVFALDEPLSLGEREAICERPGN